ncbi:lipopolysaccharide biosynthesis protein [Ruminiclostridium herbifermentans]|nr:oligosaccharide flippase family protein [Ruminiclostridium herbifermentans]
MRPRKMRIMNFAVVERIKMKYLLRKNKNNRILYESLLMFFAEGIGLSFMLFIYLIRPKMLSIDEIGLIGYVLSLVSFFSTFFIFGVDNTGARLIITHEDENSKKRIAGLTLLIGILLSFLYSIFMFIVSFFVPFFGDPQAAILIRITLPFVGYNIILAIYNQVCYALGRIKEASVQLALYSMIYFVLMIAMYYIGIFNVRSAVIVEYGTRMLVVLVPVVIIYFKYLRFYKEEWQEFKKEQKERGWTIYFSRIIFFPTLGIDSLILGYFYPLASVAHYTLSNTISAPINVIGNSLSQSLYRRFSNKNKIDNKYIMYLVLVTLASCIGCYGISFVVIKYFLGNEYMPMIYILPVTILSYAIRGVTTLYTSFMNAKGMAKEIRNCAVMGFIGNILFSFALIIPFGAIGGAVSRVIVLGVNLGMRVFYCGKYHKLEGEV